MKENTISCLPCRQAGIRCVDVKTANPDFEYDTYGNLIVDNNKGITEITYNHLILPKKITFENNDYDGTIEYLYDASGTKLRKIVTDNTTSPTTVTTTHYLDGFQYIDDKLEFFPTAEGYVNVTYSGTIGGGTTSYNYVFNYTDHPRLREEGNIRLRYAINPINQWLEILEEDHYYPFGLKHQGYNAENYVFATLGGGPIQLIPTNPDALETYKYKYNGKEWQDELELNVYDYGARNYDPALGRFFVLDLFSEQYANRTPYHYVSNNPVNKVDIEGHFEIDVKDQKTYKTLTNYLKNGIGEILSNSAIMNGLQKYGGFSEQQVRDKIVKFGKGSIKLEIRDDLMPGANGYYMGGTNRPIQIAKELAEQIENATSDEERELALLSFLITALHESVHYGEWTFLGSPREEKYQFTDKYGFPDYVRDGGRAFEIDAFWDGSISDYDGNKRGKDGMNAMKKLTKKKMSNDKIKDLTQGLQDFIKRVQEENPDAEIFIID